MSTGIRGYTTQLEKGDHLPRSNITIIKATIRDKTVAYRVKYGCCGALSDLVHNSLLSRERVGQNLCAKCAREARKEYKRAPFERTPQPGLSYAYGDTMTPDWPVPGTVLNFLKTRSW